MSQKIIIKCDGCEKRKKRTIVIPDWGEDKHLCLSCLKDRIMNLEQLGGDDDILGTLEIWGDNYRTCRLLLPEIGEDSDF